MKLRLPRSRAGRIVLALIVANEIRGALVVAGLIAAGGVWIH
jgi:hypothetical protein